MSSRVSSTPSLELRQFTSLCLAVDGVPPLADEGVLVEDGAPGTQEGERLMATAHVIHLRELERCQSMWEGTPCNSSCIFTLEIMQMNVVFV